MKILLLVLLLLLPGCGIWDRMEMGDHFQALRSDDMLRRIKEAQDLDWDKRHELRQP